MGMYPEYINELKEDVYSFLKANGNTSFIELVEKTGLDEEVLATIIGLLVKEGKVRLIGPLGEDNE